MIRFIKRVLYYLVRRIRIHNVIRWRRKYWKNEFKKNIDTSIELTKEQKKDIDNYFYGCPKISNIFHQFYLQKTNTFDVTFIPDDIYYTYIDPYFNNWDMALYMDNKCHYDKMFYSVPQPKTIVKRVNNIWLDSQNDIIDYEQVKKIIKKYSEVFLKQAVESEGGHGVYCIKNVEEFDEKVKLIQKDLIVQEPIKQSKTLNKLNSSSVNTIRVLSLINENNVKIYSSILRMGINGSRVDNASSGGITCGIEKNGRLKDVAYSSSGIKYFYHPTSKVKFSDITIPNYSKILELIKKLAPTIMHFRLVSWDIALDENDNPILIEANLRYGELDFHQLNNGPVFGKDTKKILDEVFNRKEKGREKNAK